MKKFKVKGRVELFPQKGGWFFVRLPKKFTKELMPKAVKGLIPIEAFVGSSSWNTSLLPMGDGSHFIALNVSVRKKENILLNKRVEISFILR